MTTSSMIWIMIAIAVYLLMMIFIGAMFMRKNNNSEDYFLGGRSLNGFVAALSAGASDMSGFMQTIPLRFRSSSLIVTGMTRRFCLAFRLQ